MTADPWTNEKAPVETPKPAPVPATNKVATDAFADASTKNDGSVDEQNKRANDRAVVDGEQAPLALINLVSRGMSVKAAREFLAGKAEKATEE